MVSAITDPFGRLHVRDEEEGEECGNGKEGGKRKEGGGKSTYRRRCRVGVRPSHERTTATVYLAGHQRGGGVDRACVVLWGTTDR